MLHFDFEKREVSRSRRQYKIVVNGQVVENSWASQYDDYYIGGINDPVAAETVLAYPLSEIFTNCHDLWVPFEATGCEDIDSLKLCSGFDEAKDPYLRFEFGFESEEWARPWSISKFAEAVEKATAQCSVPGLTTFRDDDEFVTNGFGFSCTVIDADRAANDEIGYWKEIIVDVVKTVLVQLSVASSSQSITERFTFPEEIAVACEQYLMYFGQFLADLGVQASVSLSEGEGHVLFSVTPTDATEALETIRSALNAYLQVPGDAAFMSSSSHSTDIAVLQLRANVLHLQSQLTLAHALLETKDATIEALRLSNYRLNELCESSVRTLRDPNQGPLSGGKKADAEYLVDGVISVRDSEIKGVVFHLPELVRRLKRRFSRF